MAVSEPTPPTLDMGAVDAALPELRRDPTPGEAAAGLYDKNARGEAPLQAVANFGSAASAVPEQGRRYVGTIVTIKPKYAFVRPADALPGGDGDDVFLHATDMRAGEEWVDMGDRVTYQVAEYRDRLKCVDAVLLEAGEHRGGDGGDGGAPRRRREAGEPYDPNAPGGARGRSRRGRGGVGRGGASSKGGKGGSSPGGAPRGGRGGRQPSGRHAADAVAQYNQQMAQYYAADQQAYGDPTAVYEYQQQLAAYQQQYGAYYQPQAYYPQANGVAYGAPAVTAESAAAAAAAADAAATGDEAGAAAGENGAGENGAADGAAAAPADGAAEAPVDAEASPGEPKDLSSPKLSSKAAPFVPPADE
jgi:cold shock CspA family protein